MLPFTQNPRPIEAEPTLPPLPPVLAQDLTRQATNFASSLAVAFRFVEPTWRNYIQYVDLEARGGNADAKKFLSAWQALPPKERIGHMPEQLCELVNIQPMDLIGWVSRQAFNEGSAKANMALSFMRDKVLEKTAEFAMESPDNYKHAELFMKAGGLIQTGSGGNRSQQFSPVSIYNMPVATATSMAAAKTTTNPNGVTNMDEQIIEISKIMQAGTTDCRAEYEPDDDDDDDDQEEEDAKDN